MKVYVVMERSYIDSEEITNIMGIFSSEENTSGASGKAEAQMPE